MTSSRILVLVGIPVGLATLAWRARHGARRPAGDLSALGGAELTALVDAERVGAAKLLALVERQRQRLAVQHDRLDRHDERLATFERRHLWRDWCLEDLEDRLSTMERLVEGCSYCAEVRGLLEATAGPGGGGVSVRDRPEGTGRDGSGRVTPLRRLDGRGSGPRPTGHRGGPLPVRPGT